MFGNSYRGRRVLLTGHTGFKGSWLALWLGELGASVHGLALPPPTRPSHWELLELGIESAEVDVRDAALVARAVRQAEPEIVFHLAAQSLVRSSYQDPLLTWSTNAMGTAHVLEACRCAASVRAIVIVTTDKCYENLESAVPFREDDKLGGHDPYSASKAAAELLAASYRRSFFGASGGALVASARAGNVIGGGDWSADRLVPDLVRAAGQRRPLEVRSPNAVRPWQHVLEPLSGYLLLGQRLLQRDSAAAAAWNFGPAAEDTCSVQAVLERMQCDWPQLAWRASAGQHPHEAGVLRLDSSKARGVLGWAPVWTLDQSLSRTARWYQAHQDTGTVGSREDLDAYVNAAAAAGLEWAQA